MGTMTMMESEREAIAAAFVAARRSGTAMAAYPAAMPGTLDDAYRTQSAVIDRWSEDIGGWKVARINEPWRSLHGSDRYVGPIFARTIVDAAAPSRFPAYAGGSAAFEAEVAITLATDADPVRRAWSIEDAATLVGGVRLVVEVAGSPLTGLSTLGPLAAITAFGNNNGLILGPEVDLAVLRELKVEVSIDGETVGRAPLWLEPAGALPAFAFALGQTAAIGRPLRRGQIVTTGALTGVHPVRIGQHGVVHFGGLATIACMVVPQQRFGEVGERGEPT